MFSRTLLFPSSYSPYCLSGSGASVAESSSCELLLAQCCSRRRREHFCHSDGTDGKDCFANSNFAASNQHIQSLLSHWMKAAHSGFFCQESLLVACETGFVGYPWEMSGSSRCSCGSVSATCCSLWGSRSLHIANLQIAIISHSFLQDSMDQHTTQLPPAPTPSAGTQSPFSELVSQKACANLWRRISCSRWDLPSQNSCYLRGFDMISKSQMYFRRLLHQVPDLHYGAVIEDISGFFSMEIGPNIATGRSCCCSRWWGLSVACFVVRCLNRLYCNGFVRYWENHLGLFVFVSFTVAEMTFGIASLGSTIDAEFQPLHRVYSQHWPKIL